MPTYDYFCAQCAHEFETFHSMNEVLNTCPECRQDTLKRKIGTGAGLIFKGSGFYQTDYKPSGNSAASGKSDSGSGGEASSKPAATTTASTAE